MNVKTSSLMDLMTSVSQGGSLEDKLSSIDCLLPIYLRQAETGFSASLRRSRRPLVMETEGMIADQIISVGIHATTGEARTAAHIVATHLGCEVEVETLPDGFVASLYCLPQAIGPRSDRCTRRIDIGNGSHIQITDYRSVESASRIVPSTCLTRLELSLALEDAGHRHDLCVFARVEAVAASFVDDLWTDCFLQRLQSHLSTLPGAGVVFSEISQEDVIERVEDMTPHDFAVGSKEDRAYITRRLQEECHDSRFANMTDGVIDKIAREIAYGFRKPAQN